MPSNLIKIKDIREFGITIIDYKGFSIEATEEQGEIEIVARIGNVEVVSVCGDTLKEAKLFLALELNDVAHTAEEINKLALAKNFVGQYDDLVNTSAKKALPVPVIIETETAIVPNTGTNLRGKSARTEVKEIAERLLGLTDVTFEKRGKYNDWFIMSKDASGNDFEQRLDVFKKKLRAQEYSCY